MDLRPQHHRLQAPNDSVCIRDVCKWAQSWLHSRLLAGSVIGRRAMGGWAASHGVYLECAALCTLRSVLRTLDVPQPKPKTYDLSNPRTLISARGRWGRCTVAVVAPVVGFEISTAIEIHTPLLALSLQECHSRGDHARVPSPADWDHHPPLSKSHHATPQNQPGKDFVAFMHHRPLGMGDMAPEWGADGPCPGHRPDSHSSRACRVLARWMDG